MKTVGFRSVLQLMLLGSGMMLFSRPPIYGAPTFCEVRSNYWLAGNAAFDPGCYDTSLVAGPTGLTLQQCQQACEAAGADCCGFIPPSSTPPPATPSSCMFGKGTVPGLHTHGPADPGPAGHGALCAAAPPSPPSVCDTAAANWTTSPVGCSNSCFDTYVSAPILVANQAQCESICESRQATCCAYEVLGPQPYCAYGYGSAPNVGAPTSRPSSLCAACVPSYDPIGNFEVANCSTLSGWACDQNDFSAPLTLKIYDGATYVQSITANTTHTGAASSCGNNNNHGFSIPNPFPQDGVTRNINIFATNLPSGTDVLLNGSPKPLSCVTLVPNASPVTVVPPPTVIEVGSVHAVSVTMLNTGNVDWLDPSFGLASLNAHWGSASAFIPVGATVNPTGSKSFAFNVTAPSTIGTYPFHWQMRQQPSTWFGTATTSVNIQVKGKTCVTPCSVDSDCYSNKCDNAPGGSNKCVGANFGTACGPSAANTCGWTSMGTWGCSGSVMTCSATTPADCPGGTGECCNTYICCPSPNICCGGNGNSAANCCAPPYTSCSGNSCGVTLPYSCTP